MLRRVAIIMAGAAGVLMASVLAGAAQAQTAPVAADIRALLAAPTMTQASVSPDGRTLAYVARFGDAEALMVQDIETGITRTLITFVLEPNGSGRRFAAFHWKGESRLLIHLRARRAMLNRSREVVYHQVFTEFISVNADGSEPRQIETSGDPRAREQILHLLPDDPDHVLIQALDDREFLGVNRVNLRTGEVERVLAGDLGVIGYYTSSDGQVVARVRLAGTGGRWGRIEGRDANGRWTRIADYFASELRQTPDFQFVGSGPRPGELYAIVRPPAGSRPDTAAIHVYDMASRTVGPPIAQHETYDMGGLLVDAFTGEALAGCYQADMWRCQFNDEAMGRQMAGLLRFFEDERDVRVVSQDRERRRWVLAVSGATEPGSFYLYDSETRAVEIIGEAYGELAGRGLTEMRRVDYQARDGQSLHGYLTLPTGGRAGPRPLIVMPHGGPEARDALGFDPWVQFLAGRGYAVFQPNFRGSSGFGRAFAEAGYRQWGQRMQDDVTDGVQALIEQGAVDPARICIVGASYGGYAALWGGASQPDLYRCVVSIAGVSDLREMLQWTRRAYGSDSETFDYWETAIGDVGRDRDQLRAVSPIEHVETWRPPVLLIHGTHDFIVPVEQSQIMDRALRRAGRDVRYVELDFVGHGFSNPETGATVLREIGAFLAEHLPTEGNPAP